uniref:Uncharacterized protein n=1 Tax=Leersia perrieri TaxID=77586 RepID=A0A0D9VSZ4_9ORYZ
MEDSVGEVERREQEETMAQGKERGVEEDAGGGGEPGGESGFLSTMASKIGAAMSGANGISGGAEEEVDGGRNGDGNVVVAAPDGEEEGKGNGNGGGGIFGKLMSRSPDSLPASGTVEAEQDKGEGGDHEGEKAGILSTVASKIGIAMSGANGHANHRDEDDAKINSNGDASDNGKVEEKGDDPNGGGIVKQLISNLPKDDQAPDAEEASLLIAIIDD